MLRDRRRQRPAWLLLLLMVVLLFAVGSSRHWFPAGLVGPIENMATPSSVILKELLQVFIVLTVTLTIATLRGQRLDVYGLPWDRVFGKDFLWGAAWGLTMLSITVALMAPTHSYSLGPIALSPGNFAKYGLLWAIAFLLAGLAEELSFRGYLQYTLTTRMGFWPAAVVTSLFLALAHRNNPGENWVGMANIVLIGMFACLALRRTGSLWFPIGWHMAFDWGESFLYSVANSGQLVGGRLFNASIHDNRWLSGGAVGPEGSVLNVAVTLSGIVVFLAAYPNVRYCPVPDRTMK